MSCCECRVPLGRALIKMFVPESGRGPTFIHCYCLDCIAAGVRLEMVKRGLTK